MRAHFPQVFAQGPEAHKSEVTQFLEVGLALGLKVEHLRIWFDNEWPLYRHVLIERERAKSVAADKELIMTVKHMNDIWANIVDKSLSHS